MPEQPLPDLAPEILLSYGGLRELEGAVAMRGSPAPTPVTRDETTAATVESWASAVDEEFSISFERDDSGDVDVDPPFRTPARGERFNVMRPPQRERFNPPPPVPGPQGGPMREVGRVGRFAILADDRVDARDRIAQEQRMIRPLTHEERVAEVREARIAEQLRARELNGKQREHRAAMHATLPTAYDRLLGEDPYEDDLE